MKSKAIRELEQSTNPRTKAASFIPSLEKRIEKLLAEREFYRAKPSTAKWGRLADRSLTRICDRLDDAYNLATDFCENADDAELIRFVDELKSCYPELWERRTA